MNRACKDEMNLKIVRQATRGLYEKSCEAPHCSPFREASTAVNYVFSICLISPRILSAANSRMEGNMHLKKKKKNWSEPTSTDVLD